MPLEKLGPYRLEKLLGRGGMGAVYAGVNELSGEKAAIKVLAAHLADNEDFRERFMAEVETLKKLKHPNIVQLLAYGEEGEHLFYVMELVPGRSLQDEMQAGRRYSWREVAKIGVDVCRALKHAHDTGVIHRDLKPANLLVDPQNQVKLTDFGIAKLYGGTQITAAGGILGTADYMSPEQAEGRAVNARSDLYSLGSVLYALLAGRPPFASKSLAEVIHGLRFEKPTPLRRLAPDVPEQFELIIMQLLEKEPANRIASAFAVANYLRAMEHALSPETQVGQITADDLPPDLPSRSSPHTVSGIDATIVSPALKTGQGTLVNDGATAQLDAESADYRVSAAEPVTYVPSSQSTHVPEAVAEKPVAVATKSRFVTIEEERKRQKKAPTDEEGPPIWALIGGMTIVALLLGGAVVYALMPPSADALYATIYQAASSGDADQLAAVDSQIDQFLQRFPDDPRAEEVKQHQSAIEARKLEKRFALRARGIGGSQITLPSEQAYLDAVRIADSEPEQAVAKLHAMIAVFENAEFESEEDRQANELALEVAKMKLADLTKQLEESSKQLSQAIESQLERADRLQEESPEAADRIYRGIVELYGNKPWAQELVGRAKSSLGDAK